MEYRVELASIELLSAGDAFVLVFVDDRREPHRMRLPAACVPQLMQWLPRVEAATALHSNRLSPDLVAHPVGQFDLQSTGIGDDAVLCIRTEEDVEAAFLVRRDDARRLHSALGRLIEGYDAAPTSVEAVINELDLPKLTSF